MNIRIKSEINNQPISTTISTTTISTTSISTTSTNQPSTIITSPSTSISLIDVASEGGFTKIAELLKDTKEMVDWLDRIDMSKYQSTFLKNEFYLFLLSDITKDQWEKHIPNEKDRLIIIKQVEKLGEVSEQENKYKEKKQTMERRKQIRKHESNLRKAAVQSAKRVIQQNNNNNNKNSKDGISSSSTSTSTSTSSSSTSSPTINTPNSNTLNPNSFKSSKDNLSSSQTIDSDLLEWEIDPEDLEFIESLGTGASGEVWRGSYKGEEVAIKVLKTQNTQKELEEFKKEFSILILFKSPRIVHIFGSAMKHKLIMVMEFCKRGSLYDVLRDDSLDFTWDKFFDFSLQIAEAIKELHDHIPQILHRDLKTLNLLVTEDYQIKVCDFGLSRFDTGSNLATLNKCRGTYPYIAPEVYKCEKFIGRSDVYSIGIILWEMANRCIKRKYEKPYEEYKHLQFDFQILIQACQMNLRPTIHKDCPPPLANLIKQVI